jgi:hypothetical protein
MLRVGLAGAGGVLAGSFVGGGTALAGGGNSACAQFCQDSFPPGSARGSCTSQAAQGSGPCYECGPAAPAGSPPFCSGVCCAAGQTCNDGSCVEICPSGLSLQCVPVCSANQVLQVQCVSCPAGETVCAGACTNTASDPNNCGACGNVCPSGTVCSGGSCVACSAGQVVCDNICTDLSTDPSNCGGCGNVCSCGTPTGGTCVGSCLPVCSSGTCGCDIPVCTSGTGGTCLPLVLTPA